MARQHCMSFACIASHAAHAGHTLSSSWLWLPVDRPAANPACVLPTPLKGGES